MQVRGKRPLTVYLDALGQPAPTGVRSSHLPINNSVCVSVGTQVCMGLAEHACACVDPRQGYRCVRCGVPEQLRRTRLRQASAAEPACERPACAHTTDPLEQVHIGLLACFALQNTLPAISHATYVPQTYITIVPTHMHRAKTSFSRHRPHNAVKCPHGTYRGAGWAGCSGNTCPSRARSPLPLRVGAWSSGPKTRAPSFPDRGRD